MATKKKLLQAAAGSAGGAGLNVEEVFSTYLYKGTDANNITATTGIDMSGEGGMVWFKGRSAAEEGTIVDSARGVDYAHYTTQTSAHFSISGLGFSAPTFTSTGFTVGDMPVINRNTTDDYVAWSFRKAPKFFDVVTYTGDGNSTKTISHSLNSTVGMIIVKRTDSVNDWAVWHRAQGDIYEGRLNTSEAFGYNTIDGASSTTFTVRSDTAVNASGGSYVAYLFAHNDGDGDFGPTGDQDIIKCGSYTGNGSTSGPSINLGFEPQWVLLKNASATGNNGILVDNMRGIGASGPTIDDDYDLNPNLSNSESPNNIMTLTPTGFDITSSASRYNGNGNTMIYIAIRRGPMAVPESATDVFAVAARTGTTASGSSSAFVSGFPVDFGFVKRTTGTSTFSSARLIQNRELLLNSTAAEGGATNYTFDSNTGMWGQTTALSDQYAWMWKRAPNFFDVVAWEGSGTSGYEYVDHNLGATPEMIWFKNRDSSATPRGNWYVYHKDLANSNGYVYLNSTPAEATDYPGWATGSFPFSDTRFVVQKSRLSYSGESYIAYLFASVDGVSKVGSFTGNGSSTGDSQDIDCGFSSSARFVLVKAISAPGAWFLFDTERGIVAGNDSHLSLNNTAAEDTSRDLIDPLNSGFTINYHSDWGNQLNGNGQTYIYYAIA